MKRKVLLMGQSGCGKTSMRSLIFSTYLPSDTRRLGSTIDIESSNVRFLGNLVLNLWDCGGQQAYMDSYLDKQRSQTFSTVGALIYVFDLIGAEGEKGADEWERDLRYYKESLSALYQYSPGAKVFCLLHKMDLVDKSRREEVYRERVLQLRRMSSEVAQSAGKGGEGFRVHCFATSIWDESLYRAWSRIVQTQIPALNVLEKHLQQLATTCSASEIVVFERTTLLVIASTSPSSSSGNPESGNGGKHVYDESEPGLEGFPPSPSASGTSLDPSRFEKASEIIKGFKTSCAKFNASEFMGVEIRGGEGWGVYVDRLTSNTVILIVIRDGGEGDRVQMSSVRLNVELARDHFERL